MTGFPLSRELFFIMKKLSIFFIVLFILAAIRVIKAQDETSMQDIQDKVSAYTKQLEQDKNYEIVNITMDLIVKDGTKSFTRYLDPSFDYIVTAFGDSRIDKLTLNVDNGTQSELNYNAESTAANASISIIKPNGSSEYEFTVKNTKYNGNNASGHFAVIIYHRIP
jgi:hypothetical protein